MTGGLRPYPEYKDSGLWWIKRIPARWEEKRAKFYFREVDERSTTGTEQLLSVSHKTGVTPRKANVTMFMAESNVGCKICRPGDLVINTMWAWMAAMGVSRQIGLVSPSYGVYRPRKALPFLPDYADYLVRTQPYVSEYICRSTGIRPSRLRLYPDDFLDIPIVCPPHEEQEAIVKFIGHHDRLVRRFIRNRRRLIGVLNEQKLAIINRAVTRGLDPNVPLKPSGIDWLGDIPQHWRIIPLKFLASRVQNGSTPPTEVERFYESGTIPWYGPSSIGSAASVYDPIRLLAESAFTEGKARLLHGPAILIVVIGATAGRMALLEGEGATNQQITAYELLRDKTIPLFVLEQLRLAEKHIRATASTATIPILDAGFVSRLPVLVPPLTEQKEILAQIQVETSGLELAKTKAQSEIDLIREYRTRLIADVVTGKVDVRHLAPSPEAMGAEAEPEDLDDETPGEDEGELALEVPDADD